MKAWSSLLKQLAAAPPLRFAHGMRHVIGHGVSCAVHDHREVEIVFHALGRGVSRAQGEADCAFDVGDVVVYAPRQAHDQVMDVPGEDFCIQVALSPNLRPIPECGFHLAKIEDSSLLDDMRLLSKGHICVSPFEQTVLNLRATALLFSLIQLASERGRQRQSHSPAGYAALAENYIRDNFATIRSLSEVAGAVGIGYDHLRHVYKNERGRNLVQFLNAMRMERAKTLLAHSRLPLKQIATMCGFRDEYYFSAVFRRHVQMPPGRYRLHAG